MPSPAVYRRRRVFALLVLVFVVGLIWFSVDSIFRGNTTKTISEASISGDGPQDLTESGANIYLTADGASAIGVSKLGVVASNGIQTPVPIASIAKTITTLVVLNKLAPNYDQAKDIEITFDQNDVVIRTETIAENGASQSVSAGLKMSLHDALSVMMLASANNYATSLAIKAFGSMDAYISEANNWLAANGMAQTSVADASGLNPNTIGTASDLVTLGLIAMDNQEVVDIVTSPEITVDGVGTVQNGNPMFGVDGVDGIKLGSTFEANNCLLYSKSIDVAGQEVRIVGVTLGLDEFSTIIEGAKQSLDQISGALEFKELIPAGTKFGLISTTDDQQFEIVTTESYSSIYIPGITFIATPLINIDSPISPNASVGELDVQLANSRNKVPLKTK